LYKLLVLSIIPIISQNFIIPVIKCRFVGLYILYIISYLIKANILLVSLLVHLGITSNKLKCDAEKVKQTKNISYCW